MTGYIQRYAIRTLLTGLSLLSLFALQVPSASAQVAGLTLKPAIVEDNVNPGQVYNFTLSATNDSSQAQTFYLVAQDIKGLDDSGQPIFAKQGEQTGYELSSWIRMPSSAVTLGPKETKDFNFSAVVPSNASPGSHFAGVFFTNQPGKLSTNGAAVGFNVGAIVSLQIAGNIVEQANLREFSTGKLIYGSANVDFKSKVENIGNVLVRPNGVIEISDMFGKKVATVTVNDATAATFPSSTRTYTTTWSSDSFSFGRYEAVVSLAYGDQARKTISGTTSFWILPLKPIAIVLAILLVVVFGFYALMRSYLRRKLRQMGVSNVSRSDADYYQQRYQKTGSRLIVVTLAIIFICILFLAALFLLFA